MAHDVYICYDKNDQSVCEAICKIFEENNIKSWVKYRDFSSSDSADKITGAITDSKCFVLIYSKTARNTNYVITETDIAFSRDVPIVVLNIDGSKISGDLEFVLLNKTMMPAFPDSKKRLKELVSETSKVIGRRAGKININSRHVKTVNRFNPKRNEETVKKYAKIAIPVVIALILIYLLFIVPIGQHTTGNSKFTMNITDVNVDGNKYTVYGESYNLPTDSVNYFMNIKFFDKNDNMVYEVNSTADEFKSGKIWEGNLHEDNVTHIGFKLTDIKGNLLSKENYVIE